MSNFLIKQWEDHFPGESSEDAIREQFVSPEDYRVSYFKYPVGTEFPGAMRPGTVFVISGKCDYNFGEVLSVAAGQFTELPGGNYSFSVTSESPVELVLVWKI